MGEPTEGGSRPRVFVVDDDRQMVDLVVARLDRDLDAEPVGSVDPEDCLRAVERGRADCVVSDYDMPDRDGLELLRAVRERDPDLPFVLFTGRGSEEIASEAVSAGVTDYVRKGGRDAFDVLVNEIERALARRRAERERRAARESLAATDAALQSLFSCLPSPAAGVETPVRASGAAAEGQTTDDDRPPVRVVYTNEAFDETFTGVADAVGESLSEAALAGGSFPAAATDGGAGRAEVTCRTAEGEREFLVTVTPGAEAPDGAAGVAREGNGGPDSMPVERRFVVFTDISEQKRLQRALERLHEATREFERARTPEAVERALVETAAAVIGYPHNGVRRHDPEAEELVPAATTEAAAEYFTEPRESYARGDPAGEHAWRAFESGEPVTVTDEAALVRGGVASKIYLPLGEWGVLTLSDPDRDGIDETEEYLGRVLAGNAAAVLARMARNGASPTPEDGPTESDDLDGSD